MTLGAKYSFYMKDDKAQGISDSDASNSEIIVGHGLDLSLRWKIFSDISVYGNYGIFFPGAAYASGTAKKHFVMAGANISF